MVANVHGLKGCVSECCAEVGGALEARLGTGR